MAGRQDKQARNDVEGCPEEIASLCLVSHGVFAPAALEDGRVEFCTGASGGKGMVFLDKVFPKVWGLRETTSVV